MIVGKTCISIAAKETKGRVLISKSGTILFYFFCKERSCPWFFQTLKWSRAENVPTVHLLYEGKTERRKQDIRKKREKIHLSVRILGRQREKAENILTQVEQCRILMEICKGEYMNKQWKWKPPPTLITKTSLPQVILFYTLRYFMKHPAASGVQIPTFL